MKLNKTQKEQIIKRYVDGESPAILAREYGVTRQSIYNVINKVNIKRVRIIQEGTCLKLAR